jgi:hypothetical protein
MTSFRIECGGIFPLTKEITANIKTKFRLTTRVIGMAGRNGPIAQLAEPPAHNRSVPGSNPGGPTSYCGMKMGVYYIRRPVEGGKTSLSGGRGSVWQRKTEIPRDSEKGCGKQAAPFFYAMARTNSYGCYRIKTKKLLEHWRNLIEDFGLRISDLK